MKAKINYPALVVFYVIAVLFRYIAVKTSLLAHIDYPFFQVILRGVGPAAGAGAAFYLFGIKSKLSFKGNYKRFLNPLLIYWGVPILILAVVSYFTKGSLQIVTIIGILVYGLLEETGWRGFLQFELLSLSKFISIPVIAILWFAWHLNFELTQSNLIFFSILLLGTWGIGKVADKTFSLLAVSAFHSLNNFFSDLNMLKISILIAFVIIWIAAILIHEKQKMKQAEAIS
jgi:membrane protease YdiL (CAAX protease family)